LNELHEQSAAAGPLSSADHPADHPSGRSRRALLIGAGVTCAAALAGCTTYDANNGGLAGEAPTTSGVTPGGTEAPAGTASASAGDGSAAGSAPAAAALASTADVPAGGGTILTDKQIVITQPQAGSFKAFTAVCTHMGCIVNSVADGTIDCPCHGSKYSIKDGSVVNGPAPRPLAPVPITVTGNSILPG
jgi:Rieske Fe-S protein